MIIKGKSPSNEIPITCPQKIIKNIKPLSPQIELMTINKNLRNIMPLQPETEPNFNKKSQTSSKKDCIIDKNIFIEAKNFIRKNTEDIPLFSNKTDMKKQLKCMDEANQLVKLKESFNQKFMQNKKIFGINKQKLENQGNSKNI